MPLRAQSAGQVDRDRWECELEAQRAADARDRWPLGIQTNVQVNTGAMVGGLAGAAVGSGLGAALGAAAGSAGTGAALGAGVGGGAGAAVGAEVARRRGRDVAEEAFRACLARRGYALQEEEVGR